MTKKTSTSTAGIPPRRHVFTHWLTRDTDANGVLSPNVRIWLAKPERFDRLPGVGHYWATRSPVDYYGEWTLEQAYFHARTVPDDDRQCIRVEGDSVRQPGETVEPA